jgi:hypothetical protein
LLREREGGLVECYVTRDEDPMAGQVETTVAFVFIGVPKEDA